MATPAFIAKMVRQVIPPILLNPIVAALRQMHVLRRRDTWQGVYGDFAAIRPRGPGYDDRDYRREAVNDVKDAIAVFRGEDGATAPIEESAVLLSVLVAMISEAGKAVRILDFAGGPGTAFVHLVHAVPVDLEYHVVELKSVCEDGTRLLADDRRIHFHSDLPDALTDIDVVYAANAIQAVGDYQGLLRRLCARQPRYVLLGDVPAGRFQRYAAALHAIPGSVIPNWFLNSDELVRTITDCGYTLLVRSPLSKTFDQANFPAALRSPGQHPSVLLFARNS